MPGPPKPQGGAANVALVAVALTMGALAFLTIGVIMMPMSFVPTRVTYDEASEPLAVPEALAREVEVDDGQVRYVWRDPELGRQVATRASEVPEWTRRWVGMMRGDWDTGDGLYFADLREAKPGDLVGVSWRPASELHAAMQAHDAAGSHAEDIALYAVELLNVDDRSERTARAKELKKVFKEELQPNLLPERAARFMIGKQGPVKVIGPK